MSTTPQQIDLWRQGFSEHQRLKFLERMTNQSLRESFQLGDDKAAIASQVIAATTEAGLIKADESIGGSRKFARYLPFWA
jgi:hypothetical protein